MENSSKKVTLGEALRWVIGPIVGIILLFILDYIGLWFTESIFIGGDVAGIVYILTGLNILVGLSYGGGLLSLHAGPHEDAAVKLQAVVSVIFSFVVIWANLTYETDLDAPVWALILKSIVIIIPFNWDLCKHYL